MRACGIAFGAMLFGFGGEALAFECTPVPNTASPLSQVWINRCIPYWIARTGTLLDGDGRRRLVEESFGEWTGAACTDLELRYAGYTSEDPGFDPEKPSLQTNIVLAIENEADLERFMGEPNLVGVTHTWYSNATGEILDADLLLNAVTFALEEVDDPAACRSRTSERPIYDLRNTLVHEIGHFIGFDHVGAAQATMFGTAAACETLKRDLSTDETDGVCAVYPTGGEAQTCHPPPDGYEVGPSPAPFRNQCEREAGGCSCRDTAGPTDLVVVVVGLGLGVWLRRSRRRHR